MRTILHRQSYRGVGFLLPALFFIALFYFFPLIQSLIYSFFRLEYSTDWLHAPFIGLENYRAVLWSPEFWQTLQFTLLFTLGVIALDISIGMLLALASFWIHPFLRSLIRTIIIIPWAIPRVIQASIWRWMFHSEAGIIGLILVKLGVVSEAPLFLANEQLALMSVVFTYVWKGASISAVFLLAGLASVPAELHDAARIDGAGNVKRFFWITIPSMLPTLLVTLLFRLRDALRVFDVIVGLTGGGPGNATESLSTYAYRIYFDFNNYGMGSAYAFIIFITVGSISVLYMRHFMQSFEFVK